MQPPRFRIGQRAAIALQYRGVPMYTHGSIVSHHLETNRYGIRINKGAVFMLHSLELVEIPPRDMQHARGAWVRKRGGYGRPKRRDNHKTLKWDTKRGVWRRPMGPMWPVYHWDEINGAWHVIMLPELVEGDDDVSAADDDVSVAGDDVSVADDDVSVADDDVSVADDDSGSEWEEEDDIPMTDVDSGPTSDSDATTATIMTPTAPVTAYVIVDGKQSGGVRFQATGMVDEGVDEDEDEDVEVVDMTEDTTTDDEAGDAGDSGDPMSQEIDYSDGGMSPCYPSSPVRRSLPPCWEQCHQRRSNHRHAAGEHTGHATRGPQ